jgi:(4S)-4-hydroxy-5-phosphonooxypentane-2,3-dione isomerase
MELLEGTVEIQKIRRDADFSSILSKTPIWRNASPRSSLAFAHPRCTGLQFQKCGPLSRKANPGGKSMLTILVHAHVKTDSVDAFRTASRDNAVQSIQEPGVVRFDILEQSDDPTRFLLIEAYRDPASAAAHKETAHYKTWRDAVAEMMAEPRASVRYEWIQA